MPEKTNIFLFDASITFSKVCDILSKEHNSIILNYVSKRDKTRYSDIQRELKKNNKSNRSAHYIIKKLVKEGMMTKVKTVGDNCSVTNYTLTFKGDRALELEKHLTKHIKKEKKRSRK